MTYQPANQLQGAFTWAVENQDKRTTKAQKDTKRTLTEKQNFHFSHKAHKSKKCAIVQTVDAFGGARYTYNKKI